MLRLNIYKSRKDAVSQIVYSFIEQISVKCLLQVDTRVGTGEIRTNHTWFLCKRTATHEWILYFIANYTWGVGPQIIWGNIMQLTLFQRLTLSHEWRKEFASARVAERKQHKEIHRDIKKYNIQEKWKHLCMAGI